MDNDFKKYIGEISISSNKFICYEINESLEKKVLLILNL